MKNRCPLCGEHNMPDIKVPGIDYDNGDLYYYGDHIAHFGPRKGMILEIALQAWPRTASYERIIFHCWPDAEEPTDPINVITTHCCHIRRALAPFRLRIGVVRSYGVRFYLPNEEWQGRRERREPTRLVVDNVAIKHSRSCNLKDAG